MNIISVLQAAPGCLPQYDCQLPAGNTSASYFQTWVAPPPLIPNILLIAIIVTGLVVLLLFSAYEGGRHSVSNGDIIRSNGLSYRVKLVRVKLKYEEVPET